MEWQESKLMKMECKAKDIDFSDLNAQSATYDENENESLILKNDASYSSSKYAIMSCYVKLSTSETTFCPECHQLLSGTIKFKPSNGCSESEAVKETRMTSLMWQEALTSNLAPEFKMTSVCVYDKKGHFVSISKGLIEDGIPIYLSGTLHNISNHEEQLKVDRIGPLVSWEKPLGWKSPLIVLSTELEGKTIKYHILSTEFTKEYKEALQKCIFVERYWNSKPWMKRQPTKRNSRSVNYDSDFEDSSDEDFLLPSKKKKTTKVVRKSGKGILESFGKEPGYGSPLIDLLPAKNIASADALASFLCFVFERQTMWSNRRKGKKILTSNPVLAEKFFTNMYRELDKGTIYFRRHVNQIGLKGVASNERTIDVNLVSNILFKSIIYRLLNKRDTFIDFGGIPDLGTLPKFLKFLRRRKSQGAVIFTAAHQNMGFDRLIKTYGFVQKNILKLTSDVVTAAKRRSTKMCFEAILKIPNVGNFFAHQILCDLLECKILGPNVSEDQWVCLGPGAKNGLRRIFALESTEEELKYTRLIRELCSLKGSKSGFLRLGMEFPAFLQKPLSLKTIEHALCEFSKYFRYATNDSVSGRTYQSKGDQDKISNNGLCANNEDLIKCLLCDITFQQFCNTYSMNDDHAFLCKVCLDNETSWASEDFKYQEEE